MQDINPPLNRNDNPIYLAKYAAKQIVMFGCGWGDGGVGLWGGGVALSESHSVRVMMRLSCSPYLL